MNYNTIFYKYIKKMIVRNKLSPPLFWRFFGGAKFGETRFTKFSAHHNLAPPIFLKNGIGKNLSPFPKNLINVTLTRPLTRIFFKFLGGIKVIITI